MTAPPRSKGWVILRIEHKRSGESYSFHVPAYLGFTVAALEAAVGERKEEMRRRWSQMFAEARDAVSESMAGADVAGVLAWAAPWKRETGDQC